MATMTSTKDFEEQLHACIKALLPEEFILTKPPVVDGVADAAVQAATSKLQLEKANVRRGSSKLDLLKLPAELRNRSYEYTVILPHEIPLGQNARDFSHGLKPALQPAISRTCRQLRREYYGQNCFWTEISQNVLHRRPSLELARRWLRTVGPANAKRITVFTFRAYSPPEKNPSLAQLLSDSTCALVAHAARYEQVQSSEWYRLIRCADWKECRAAKTADLAASRYDA